jgi:hypothetical protein
MHGLPPPLPADAIVRHDLLENLPNASRARRFLEASVGPGISLKSYENPRKLNSNLSIVARIGGQMPIKA